MNNKQSLGISSGVRGGLMVVAAAALWGSFSLFLRPAERMVKEQGGTLSAATQSFIFFLVVLVTLTPFALTKRTLSPPTRKAWVWMLFFSVADALNLLFYFGAMQHTTVAVSVLTHYLAPIFVALLAPFILSERAQKGTWLAATFAILGLVLLLEPHRMQAGSSLVGPLLGALSAVLFAGVVISMKRLGNWFTTHQILSFHYPVALIILYLFIPAGELSMDFKPLMLLILCGLLPGTFGGYLFVEGVRFLPASRAGILTLIEPLVAVLIGVIFWRERPGLVAIVGACVILFSAYKVLKGRAQ